MSDSDARVTQQGGSGVEKKSPSLERIRRLEHLERERLEEQSRKAERRRQVISGAKPSGGRHDLVDRIEETVKYPMVGLGVAWLVVGIAVATGAARGMTSTALVAVLFALWVIMLAEYLVRLVVSPDTRGYIRRRWMEPATVVLPPLQGFRLVGIEKTGLLLREAELRLQAILRHHSLFRVLLAVVGTLFLGAWLVLLFEENAKGSNIHSYPDALWWAIVTVTTVGYGDRFPVSAGGRIVAVVLMIVGIGLIGVLTATIASLFMKEHTDANKEEVRKSHASIGQQLAVISQRLADVERRLGASDADLARLDDRAQQEAAEDEPAEGGKDTASS